MAIKARIPSSASQITAGGSVPYSINSDIWLGFSTPITSSGCVMFYDTAAGSTAGRQMLTIALSPAQQFFVPYPFNSPSGIFVAAASGGSPFAWAVLGGSGLG